MEKMFTISVFTENTIGMLNRITIIFTRRHINIESLTALKTNINGVYRFTIVVKTTSEQSQKVVKQIEKQIEVLKAFVHEGGDTMFSEYSLNNNKTNSLLVKEYEKAIC